MIKTNTLCNGVKNLTIFVQPDNTKKLRKKRINKSDIKKRNVYDH